MGLEAAFWILAVVMVVSALGVVLIRNIFRAALTLILCFIAVAGIYITLSANLSNVLDNRNVITGGYEQYRYDPERPDLFQPRVYYANGFNYFINLSIRY